MRMVGEDKQGIGIVSPVFVPNPVQQCIHDSGRNRRSCLLESVQAVGCSCWQISVDENDKRMRRILPQGVVQKFTKAQAELFWRSWSTGTSENPGSMFALSFNGEDLARGTMPRRKFSMSARPILLVLSLNRVACTQAGCFGKQFVPCALELIAVLHSPNEQVIKSAVVRHRIEIVREGRVSGEEAIRNSGKTAVRLRGLSIHEANGTAPPLHDRVSFGFGLRKFSITPFFAEDRRHVVAQEIRKEFPVFGVMQRAANRYKAVTLKLH